MATMTQTATTPPSSPRRRSAFGISSISPKKVVSRVITAPKRFASTPDFGRSPPTSPRRQSTTPMQQQRVVSTPVQSGESAQQREAEAAQALGRVQVASSSDSTGNDQHDIAASMTSASTTRSLSFPHVAGLFIKLRRVQNRAKANHITSSSGDAPKTHPSLAVVPVPVVIAPEPEAGPSSPIRTEHMTQSSSDDASIDLDVPKRRARLEIRDEFVCATAVDVQKLLRASRISLLEHAQLFRANVLVDEQWSCSISLPKHKNDGHYRVHIRYNATAARSARKDPRQPIALDAAKGVSGLMTIVSRDIVAISVQLIQE